jgi:hypothetical protein
MISRALFILPFFLLIVGSGTVWLLISIRKRKKLLQNLLSLPKERRFFWYLLRKGGYRITALSPGKDFSVWMNGKPGHYTLKADFTARKGGRTFVCLVHDGGDERETLKQYFIYSSVFNSDGVVFYHENQRNFSVFE